MKDFILTLSRCTFAFVAVFVMLIIGQTGASAVTLGPGDVVIIGVRADDIDGTIDNGNDDAFAWVPLVDLDAGQMIFFTDDGWTSTGFDGDEGAIKYTAPDTGLAAGTVMLLVYSRNATEPGVHTFTPDPNLGTYESINDANVGTLGFETSAAGDNIFIFDGSTGSPNFIFGVKTEGTTWETTADEPLENDESLLPAALSRANAVLGGPGATDNFDNLRYTGLTTGTPEELLARIASPSNWETSNDLLFSDATNDITNGTGGSSGSGFNVSPVPSTPENMLEVTLLEGVNFMSVPLDPGVQWHLSDLARHIGPGVSFIVWSDTQAQRFVSYFPDFPETSPANIPVVGGDGYIVVMNEPVTVTFVGSAWGTTRTLAGPSLHGSGT
ncbi:MAG: hypothetical protein O7E52_01325, partial [Candidatus Poribacteria bacterium]|nr:hypothetical protein [Candidatus Poribacteria bacterium]